MVSDVNFNQSSLSFQRLLQKTQNHLKNHNYIVLNILGSGGSGTVWKIQDEKDGKFYAVKSIRMFPHILKSVPNNNYNNDDSKFMQISQLPQYYSNEIEILKQLSSSGQCLKQDEKEKEYTPFLFYYNSIVMDDTLYIIMEDLSSWIELFNYLFDDKWRKDIHVYLTEYHRIAIEYENEKMKNMTNRDHDQNEDQNLSFSMEMKNETLLDYHLKLAENELKFRIDLINKMIDIVRQLHSRNIAHRDIKPENFLYDPSTGRLKLIDFGYSCSKMINDVDDVDDYQRIGTNSYMAPEINQRIDNLVYNFETNRKSDMWSLALTIETILYGTYFKYPFWDTYIKDSKNVKSYRKTHQSIYLFIQHRCPSILKLITNLKQSRTFIDAN